MSELENVPKVRTAVLYSSREHHRSVSLSSTGGHNCTEGHPGAGQCRSPAPEQTWPCAVRPVRFLALLQSGRFLTVLSGFQSFKFFWSIVSYLGSFQFSFCLNNLAYILRAGYSLIFLLFTYFNSSVALLLCKYNTV